MDRWAWYTKSIKPFLCATMEPIEDRDRTADHRDLHVEYRERLDGRYYLNGELVGVSCVGYFSGVRHYYCLPGIWQADEHTTVTNNLDLLLGNYGKVKQDS